MKQSVVRWLERGALFALLSAAVAIAPPAAVAATDYTWTGASSASSWSDGTNWGGSAPSASVGTLTFPELTSAACARPLSGAQTCYSAMDDLGSVQVNDLSIDPADGYDIVASGAADGLTLGEGGLQAITPPSSNNVFPSSLSVPITLAAPQTWSLDGAVAGADLTVGGGMSGSSSNPLDITLADGSYLELAGADDVGPVSIAGTGSGELTGAVRLLGGDLNGGDQRPVSVNNAGIVSRAAETIGPLSSTDGFVGVGDGGPTDGNLTVDGSLTLDSASTLELFIDLPGTTPIADYSLLRATGDVDLGGATLELVQGHDSQFDCASLNPGDVDTLVSTTGGTLTGTFKNVPDGTVVNFDVDCGGGPNGVTARINYTPTSVTATIGAAPSWTELPAVSGTAEVGQMLSATTGSWTHEPTSFAYQWERCPAESGCMPINDATGPTYTVTEADIGDRITVAVSASNEFGGSVPVEAQSTAAVPPLTPAATSFAAITGAPVVGQTLTETHATWTNLPTSYSYQWERCTGFLYGCVAIAQATTQSYTLTSADVGDVVDVHETAANSYGSGPPVMSWPSGPVTMDGTPAEIGAALATALAPPSAPPNIPSLLQSGGYTTTFDAPAPGMLALSWYESAPNASVASSRKAAAPVLIATARRRFQRAGRGRVRLRLTKAGKRFLRRAKRARLTVLATFTSAGHAATSETRTLKLRR